MLLESKDVLDVGRYILRSILYSATSPLGTINAHPPLSWYLCRAEGLFRSSRALWYCYREQIGLPGASQGILVLSWTPCHSFNRSPRAALTKRCCLSMFRPRNFSDPISMPYMDPQPPEISCTMSSVGANSAASMSQTLDSPSLKKSGLAGAAAFVDDSVGEEAAAALEKVLCVEEIVRTCICDCGDWV